MDDGKQHGVGDDIETNFCIIKYYDKKKEYKSETIDEEYSENNMEDNKYVLDWEKYKKKG